MFHVARFPSQPVRAQTTTMVANELAAIAAADGGGGATVIPTTVRVSMESDSAVSQSFLTRERLGPEKTGKAPPR